MEQQHNSYCEYCTRSVARYDKHRKSKSHLLNLRNNQNLPRPTPSNNVNESSKSDYIWYDDPPTTQAKGPSIEVDTVVNNQLCSVRIESKDLLHDEFNFECLNSKWDICVSEVDEEYYFELISDTSVQVTVKALLCSSTQIALTSTQLLHLSANVASRWTDFGSSNSDPLTVLKLYMTKISSEPEPQVAERIKCPAEARLIMNWAHKHNITERALTEWFAMNYLPTFNHKNIPRTVHDMKKMARVATPEIELQSAVDRNNVRFYFYKPEDILRVMLASTTITDGWHHTYVNQDEFVHQSNSELWQYLQTELQPLVCDGCNLLFPQFFYDDFNLSRFSPIVTDDLLVNIANSAVDVQMNREFKYLCCSMQANKWDIISTVLMPFQHLLENGQFEAYFAPAKQIKRFCGSIFTFIGDYMGHCEMIGLIGPKARVPSRLTERTQSELSAPAPLIYRDADSTYSFLSNIVMTGARRGHKVRNQEQLRSKGFQDNFEMSPLWGSKLLRYKFFQRLAPCLLHSEVLGNLLRHLNFVGKVLGSKKIEEVNERIAKVPRRPGSIIIQGIYETSTSKTTGEEKIKVKWSTGPKLQSFFQIATTVLRGLIDDDKLQLLADHIRLTQALHQPRWTTSQIDVLQEKIEQLKASLQSSYKAPEFKWQTVKFEALSAWPSFIKLIAPPYLMSTQTWEVVHQDSRRVYNLTNKQLTARDYIKKTIERKLIKHHQNSLESDNRLRVMNDHLSAAKRDNPDYKAIGKLHIGHLPSLLLSKCKRLLQQLNDEPTELLPTKVWTATGFYYNQTILRTEDSFSFSSPLLETLSIGTITNIYVLKCNNSDSQLWVQCKAYNINEKVDPSGNYVLTNAQTVMIPLGQFSFAIERREHVVPDFITPSQCLVNAFWNIEEGQKGDE